MMSWWWVDDVVMMNWWWNEGFRAAWNNQTEMLDWMDWIGLGYPWTAWPLDHLTVIKREKVTDEKFQKKRKERKSPMKNFKRKEKRKKSPMRAKAVWVADPSAPAAAAKQERAANRRQTTNRGRLVSEETFFQFWNWEFFYWKQSVWKRPAPRVKEKNEDKVWRDLNEGTQGIGQESIGASKVKSKKLKTKK